MESINDELELDDWLVANCGDLTDNWSKIIIVGVDQINLISHESDGETKTE